MPRHPLLNSSEQANLPRLTESSITLPSQFEDSTHQAFLCDTVDERMVLKVCDEAAVAKSGFWQGANHLFGADFPKSLAQIERTHDLLNEQGLYAVPEFVASSQYESEHGFVLTRFIEGVDMTAEQVTDAMVVDLAQHIAQLHQLVHSTWGPLHKGLHAPRYEAAEWGRRLQATLPTLAAKSAVSVPEALLRSVLLQAGQVHESEFVPMMLDLRWDQFRRIDGAPSDSKPDTLALIDLDAFVMAPRALDLVLLEYILTPPQFVLFKDTYTNTHDWSDYTVQKPCYQLLLFLMQVLGETDLARWMQRI